MGGVHGEGDPLTLGVDDRTQWVLDRIVDLFPGADKQFVPQMAISLLEEAVAALRGRSGYTLFGLSSTSIAVERHTEVLALLDDALGAWREWARSHEDEWGHLIPDVD